jgi:ADP-dependent NAD(P)H-hydrate dehydratase / NAD(P)H-hydrate epimerase
MSTDYTPWTAQDAARLIAVPREDDDKYSRGVLGVITGSTQYPGAAVLGVEAALRTGVGMVRYLGPERPSSLVLSRRPEAVTANGRVQAWLIGSGMAQVEGSESVEWMSAAVGQDVPIVLDGGAFELHSKAVGPVVLTPHFRELARVVGDSPEDIARDPASAAAKAADTLGVTVLLKGHTTYVASPDGTRLSASLAPSWLATAGAGDALGGLLGALVATHAADIAKDPSLLARLAASASVIHGLAGERASAGGPLTILDLATEISATIAALLAG